jgi:hypothetical protein
MAAHLMISELVDFLCLGFFVTIFFCRTLQSRTEEQG